MITQVDNLTSLRKSPRMELLAVVSGGFPRRGVSPRQPAERSRGDRTRRHDVCSRSPAQIYDVASSIGKRDFNRVRRIPVSDQK